MHGCFHVFKENKQFIKYKSSLTNPIKNQVLEKLEYLQKCYTHQSIASHPISTTVVLGGNKKEKLAAIQSNEFLKNSYNELSKTSGYLMIYGFSYGTSDEHLLDAINQSSLKRIYLGYFNKEDKQRARQWATVIDDRIKIKLFSTKGIDLSKP